MLLKEEKTCLNVAVSVDTVNKIRVVSKKNGTKINFIVEKAVEEYIDKYNLLADIYEPAVRDSPGKEAPA